MIPIRPLKSALGSALYRSRLHRLALRDRAVVAVFHRVDDRYPGNPITVSTAFFRELCAFFAASFTIVRFGRLVQMLHEGLPVGRHLAITFDDGYRDNHATAAPVLEAFGLPACFFVSTGFIGTVDTPWWDQGLGISSEWMSWDEVRDLHARGFEIGAHTISHVDLGRVEGETAQREIVGGRRELEERLAAQVDLFSYPFGRRDQITEPNRQLVRSAGFRCCASAYGGTVATGTDPYRLRRLPVSDWHRSAGQYGFEAAFSKWD